MKKIIYVIACILCASLAQAQTYTPDDMLTVLGFTVTIDSAGTGSDPDSAWETCSGGALNIEVADSSMGCVNDHTTTPGHKYIDTFSNLRISGKCNNSISSIDKSEMNIQVTENGFYSLRFEGYDAAGTSLFRFICKQLYLKNLHRNNASGIDASRFKLTITYNLDSFSAEILLRNEESATHLTLYECEPILPMAFGDPTYPLLQNLANVEVKIDKAAETAP
ncbi:MAG: hypothetical protein C4518_08800 [Desulfobacteraceae bacterium]|nr:MAG: hypothetical protein C4518_08800 [Desulfobacteraceae bacterium]